MNTQAVIADRRHAVDLDSAIGRGLLRHTARDADELALIQRFELLAFMRDAKTVKWCENSARDRVLWFEHRIAGVRTGCIEGVALPDQGRNFTTGDLAAITDEQLFAPRVHLARISVLRPTTANISVAPTGARYGRTTVSHFSREYRDVLTLAPSYEEALAGWGKHTRRNLRNVRKQGVAQGFRFEGPTNHKTLDEGEILKLARRNFPYQTPPRRVRKFEAYMRTAGNRFHSCVRDAHGALVSYCGGFLEARRAYIAYQLNDSRLRDLSPSLLHRGYLIEALIGAGVEDLVFISGCNGVLVHACNPTTVEDAYLMHPSVSSLARTAALSLVFPGEAGIGHSARAAYSLYVESAR